MYVSMRNNHLEHALRITNGDKTDTVYISGTGQLRVKRILREKTQCGYKVISRKKYIVTKNKLLEVG